VRTWYGVWGRILASEQTVARFDGDAFEQAVARFALIGEVGLDWHGDSASQTEMFRRVLQAASDQPVLLSVHSTGRCSAVLDEIERAPHAGVILHWFNGSAAEVERAVRLGCYFSVNAAMSEAGLGPHAVRADSDGDGLPGFTRQDRGLATGRRCADRGHAN